MSSLHDKVIEAVRSVKDQDGVIVFGRDDQGVERVLANRDPALTGEASVLVVLDDRAADER